MDVSIRVNLTVAKSVSGDTQIEGQSHFTLMLDDDIMPAVHTHNMLHATYSPTQQLPKSLLAYRDRLTKEAATAIAVDAYQLGKLQHSRELDAIVLMNEGELQYNVEGK